MVSLPISPTALRRLGSNSKRSQSISIKTLVLSLAVGMLVIYWAALFWFFGTHLLPHNGSTSRQRTLRAAAATSSDENAAVIVDEPQRREDTPKALATFHVEPVAAEAIHDSPYTNTEIQPRTQPSSRKIPANQRYLMFVPMTDGQGLGNIMNGLLAAHLFGDEFNRRVCVSTEFKGFHMLFQPVQDGLLEECALFPQLQGGHQGVVLFNYGILPDECALRDLLASPAQLLFYIGNTYPRWPIVPERYFETLYKPRPELISILPWKTPPQTVVHLREPDPTADHRDGLDDTTLQVLGKTLPRDTFLVTNRVEWYDMFESKYGWSHPEWNLVIHSANAINWGSRTNTTRINESESFKRLSLEDQQTLQMFCDWYTISQGSHVLHTHSDFSLSAIHFMNIHNSQTILGTDNNHLNLVEESWRRDGETPRLIDRKPDNLRSCALPVQLQLQQLTEMNRHRVSSSLLSPPKV